MTIFPPQAYSRNSIHSKEKKRKKTISKLTNYILVLIENECLVDCWHKIIYSQNLALLCFPVASKQMMTIKSINVYVTYMQTSKRVIYVDKNQLRYRSDHELCSAELSECLIFSVIVGFTRETDTLYSFHEGISVSFRGSAQCRQIQLENQTQLPKRFNIHIPSLLFEISLK